MPDFSFIHNSLANQWVISAPKRSKRPDQFKNEVSICPFCPGQEKGEPSVFRIGGTNDDSNWITRVIENKYKFAPIHEVIIHSQDHHKNFDELPLGQVETIIQTFRQRYNTHKSKGTVFILHNHGNGSGESLVHPHSQLAVIPQNVELQIPPLPIYDGQMQKTKDFLIFCPITSQWPDEVWITPQKSGTDFGEITDSEIQDFSFALARIIEIFDLRHGQEFPFNFYISPWKNWYLRLIPRLKIIGGFEIGTNVYVNTQDPKETMEFILEHFENPNKEKILHEHQAKYKRGV
jgi:UDPglucose--hexose-1-phosphate uridylyltransferase